MNLYKLALGVACLAFALGASATMDLGDASILTSYKGHTAVLSTSAERAGAISSLTWDGKEFIQDETGGLQAQFIVSFDGDGGCYQAVEAGGITYPSILLSETVTGSRLTRFCKKNAVKFDK